MAKYLVESTAGAKATTTRGHFLGKDKASGRTVIVKRGEHLELSDDEAAQLTKLGYKVTNVDIDPTRVDTQFTARIGTREVGTSGQPFQRPAAVRASLSRSASANSADEDWNAVVEGGTVSDLKDLLAKMDSADDVRSLRKAEEARESPRKGVLDAADSRAEELDSAE